MDYLFKTRVTIMLFAFGESSLTLIDEREKRNIALLLNKVTYNIAIASCGASLSVLQLALVCHCYGHLT